MKSILVSILGLLATLPAGAASLREGEFTRVINDVKVLPPQAQAFAAKIGDRVAGKSAVATGVQSRAELRFADKTLTRIGANSVFRMDQASRTIELDRGVILLQVPKQLGGAKVRTAAVTAAVTGTTLMVEFTPDGFIKIIVIEGEVDVFLNDDPSSFRTLVAGDMWITRADDKSGLPLPVQIDLERLQRTSKLLDPRDFAPLGNERHIQDALDDQGRKKRNGELLKTMFQIEGRGRRVTLLPGERQHIPGTGIVLQDRPEPNGGQPGPGGPGRRSAPGGAGAPRPINNPGTTIFDDNSSITTNPHANAYNSVAGTFVVMPGTHYFPGADGPFNTHMYGDPQTYTGIDVFLASRGPWFVFKGDEIYVVGNPAVNSASGPRNLILGAGGDVHFTFEPPFFMHGLAPSGSWTLDSSTDALAVTSRAGSIHFNDFYLTGGGQDVAFYAYGPASDINVIGSPDPYGEGYSATISFPGGMFDAYAGRNFHASGALIEARDVSIFAERDVEIGGTAGGGAKVKAAQTMRIQAQQSVRITNSSQLRRLADLDNVGIFLDAVNGNVEVLENSSIDGDTVSLVSQRGDVRVMDSSIAGREIKARVYDTGGTLLISNSLLGSDAVPAQLIKLYGEGVGGVVFAGDTILNGTAVDIAGKSVTIQSGGRVQLSHPTGTRVFSDAHNYNNGTHGNFTAKGSTTPVGVTQGTFGGRPPY